METPHDDVRLRGELVKFQLHGKVAVVTGGSGGIGGAICRSLSDEGAHVVVGYFQHEDAARSIASDIERRGRRATVAWVDVRDGGSVDRFFREAYTVYGGIDILVNCAGTAAFWPIAQWPDSDWDEVIDTNLKGAFLCCRAALPYFNLRGAGDVVNISSLAARTGSYEGGPYAASKAGLNALTLSLAQELANRNIRVNGLAPGRIATPFRRALSGSYFDFMLDQTPQKRMGSVDEIARAATFLASRACEFLTGETLYVTGGLQTVHLGHVTPDADSKLASQPPSDKGT